MRKKYKQKPKPAGVDTTIPNMMGYSGSGSVNMDHKDYGKIKPKGGSTKSNKIRNA
jgi:hypothetical protein